METTRSRVLEPFGIMGKRMETTRSRVLEHIGIMGNRMETTRSRVLEHRSSWVDNLAKFSRAISGNGRGCFGALTLVGLAICKISSNQKPRGDLGLQQLPRHCLACQPVSEVCVKRMSVSTSTL